MKLKKLTLKNIRSYKEQEIDFPEGSILLAGEVGSGKTSILLAIEYALFGLQPGQKGSALLRSDSDLGEVCLELEVSGKEVIIERKIKRGSKSVTNDYASVTIDGKKMESSITEVKTKILGLLGYPSEFIKKNNILYRYTVYTPQENMKQIILEEPETRLNILRHVFGIDKYKKIRENLSIILNKLKEESKILQVEIQNLDDEKVTLSNLKLEIEDKKNNVILRQKDLLEIIKKRKEIEEESENLENKIREKLTLESEIEKTKIFMASKREALSSIIKEYEELSRIVLESKETFKQEDLENLIKEIELSKNRIDSLNEDLITNVTNINSLEISKSESLRVKERVFSIDLCPTCLQNVPDFHKHNIVNATDSKLREIKNKLEILESENVKTRQTLEYEKNNLKILEEKKNYLIILKSKNEIMESNIRKIESLHKIKETLDKDLIILSSHLNGLKEQVLSFSIFDNKHKAKKEELKNAFLQEKKSEISIAELNKEIELKQKEAVYLESSILKKEIIKQKLANLLEIISWLSIQFLSLISFTEKNVLIKLRNEFSRLFSSWFYILVGDSFEVKLDENFTPLIMQNEVEMEYSFLSGGERTAIALSYRLALNQTINSLLSTIKTKDIIILDEPTEGFSESQIEKIREILDELNVVQLIMVSHEQKVEGFVDNILRVRKDSGISSILSSSNLSMENYQKP